MTSWLCFLKNPPPGIKKLELALLLNEDPSVNQEMALPAIPYLDSPPTIQ